MPGAVERRAVGDAGAHDRQAEREVHGRVHAEEFEGDVPLVVIHGNNRVKFAVAGADHQRISRDGTCHI